MPHREVAADAERALLAAIRATGWCDDAIAALASEAGVKVGRSTIARYRGGSRAVPVGLCALLLGQMPAEDMDAALSAYRRGISARERCDADPTGTARETLGVLFRSGGAISDSLADGVLSDDELRDLDLSALSQLLDRLSALQRRALRTVA